MSGPGAVFPVLPIASSISASVKGLLYGWLSVSCSRIVSGIGGGQLDATLL